MNDSSATAQQGCGAKGNAAVEIIENRESKPRRIPSQKWRDLIKKVWEVDPLLCPQCHHEMRIVSLINDAQIIERILRHVGSGGVDQWVDEVCNHGVRIAPSTGPPVEKSVVVSGIFDRGRQCTTLSPGACSSAPRWYIQSTESPPRSGFVGRSPATLEKRIPINN